MKKLLIIIYLVTSLIFSINSKLAFAANTENQAIQQETTSNIVHAVETDTHQEAESKSEEKTGIVGMFGLNWKLFVAQLINFAIVLFVLWKWVFGPITKGLKERANKIEASLQKAEDINNEKINFDAWKEAEIKQAKSEAAAIITTAKQDAVKVKDKILEEAKLESQKLQDNNRQQLEKQSQEALAQVKLQIADIIVNATEKIIKQKISSDNSVDKKIIDDAVNQAKGSV